MNENTKRAWEAMFTAPGYGSLLPGPRVEMHAPPEFVDNEYELVIPMDTPEVDIQMKDAGAANTLTITLPTSIKCVGKSIILGVLQTGTPCIIVTNGIYTGLGSEDLDNGLFLLRAVKVSDACVWVPFTSVAMPKVT